MKSFREYVAEIDLSREKPDYADIIDKRQQPAPGKGSLPGSNETTINKTPATSTPTPVIPKPRLRPTS